MAEADADLDADLDANLDASLDASLDHGIIAVDKMGAKVLFLDPATYATEVVIDGFPRTVHELLVVPETGFAYVPIFGDGIHGRNPNPQHHLCVFDLHKRVLADTIDLRPYIAPHTLKLGPDGFIYITCENSAAVVVIDRNTNKVSTPSSPARPTVTASSSLQTAVASIPRTKRMRRFR